MFVSSVKAAVKPSGTGLQERTGNRGGDEISYHDITSPEPEQHRGCWQEVAAQ